MFACVLTIWQQDDTFNGFTTKSVSVGLLHTDIEIKSKFLLQITQFFLVTIVQTGESIILGYFLIETLNTLEKSQLIQSAIDKINETGAILLSIAFDGLKTNFSACERLGASFNISEFNPFFIDLATKRRIYIVLDPPHMLKLVRNCLSAKGHLKDGDDNDIAWIYFERLLSAESDLISNRMTRKHMDQFN